MSIDRRCPLRTVRYIKVSSQGFIQNHSVLEKCLSAGRRCPLWRVFTVCQICKIETTRDPDPSSKIDFIECLENLPPTKFHSMGPRPVPCLTRLHTSNDCAFLKGVLTVIAFLFKG